MTRPGKAALLRGGLIIVGGVLLFVVLVSFGGAHVEPPTVGLALAGVMLLYALRRLFLVAAALGRPDTEALGRGRVSKGELRDDKRRLLRAIKELEFDYGMGKLSKQDYESVSSAYKMRAIEVMRALEGDGGLHPEVAALLRGETLAADVDGPVAAADVADQVAGESPAAATTDDLRVQGGAACPSCATANDDDARFCKRCGTALEHA